MRSPLRRPVMRTGLLLAGVVACALGADALAVIIVHGNEGNRHKCWICETNPPAGQDCTLSNAQHVEICALNKCAYCGWANGSPTMSCADCNNGYGE